MPDSKPPSKNGNGKATMIAMIVGTVINAVLLGGFGTFCYSEMSETRASTSALSQAVMSQEKISSEQKKLLQNHIEHLKEAADESKDQIKENKQTIESIRDLLIELKFTCKKNR